MKNSMYLIGGCSCESIRYEYIGSPILSYKCHCLDCQAASGSGFVALFWARKSSFQVTSGEPNFRISTGTSGMKVKRAFCQKCGNSIFAELDVLPSIVGIVAASLDDPSVFVPEYEVWVSRARHWDVLDLNLEHLDGNFSSDIIHQRLQALSSNV